MYLLYIGFSFLLEPGQSQEKTGDSYNLELPLHAKNGYPIQFIGLTRLLGSGGGGHGKPVGDEVMEGEWMIR